MSQLPNAANATIDDAKITQYLLNSAHPIGVGKAKFFTSFGFSQANWAELKKALFEHLHNNVLTYVIPGSYGNLYEISCSIVTPDGRNPCIISVWTIEPPNPNPRFVTAYANP